MLHVLPVVVTGVCGRVAVGNLITNEGIQLQNLIYKLQVITLGQTEQGSAGVKDSRLWRSAWLITSTYHCISVSDLIKGHCPPR
jgi:hypothetical protein